MSTPPIRLQTPLVGRARLVEQLRTAMAPSGPRVCFVHGIGGIGKSSVLRAFAAAADLPVHAYDALTLGADIAFLADETREGVVIVDGLDQAPGTAEMIRRTVVPRLASDSRLVLASRNAPSLRWGADLGSDGFNQIKIQGLSKHDADDLLAQWGVEDSQRGTLVEMCAGHPLMLVLAAQLPDIANTIEAGLDPAPDLVIAMVEALGAAPQDPMLRDAVLLCAIARRTTEPLLRSVLEVDDAREVFDALASQSWALRDRDGLYPHDLVRSAQRAEAKWRDRETYDRFFTAIAQQMVSRLRAAGSPALPDLMFLLADNTFYRRIAAHRHGASPGATTTTTDLELIRTFFEPHYGIGHVRRLQWLIEEDLVEVHVLHGPDGSPTEMMPVLDSAVLFRDEPTGDVMVDCARRLAKSLNFRPGSQVLFGIGACHHEHGLTSPLGNARILGTATRMALDIPNLVSLGSVVFPADLWLPMLERNPTISAFEVVEDDTKAFIVQFQDLRVLDIPGWLEMQLYPPPGSASAEVEMLDRDEFSHAVREVLKALTLPGHESIEACRFCRTPVALREAAASDGRPGDALRTFLLNVVASTTDERSRAALTKTYVEASPKQFTAAAELGLSFSTYRRALARGVADVTDRLWESEVSAQ